MIKYSSHPMLESSGSYVVSTHTSAQNRSRVMAE